MDVHLVIRGRVQGVGFRWFVRESARAAGVAGWVRNRTDGSVEVAASGEDAVIEAFRSVLRHGPPAADVVAIDELELLSEDLPKPFTILR